MTLLSGSQPQLDGLAPVRTAARFEREPAEKPGVVE
jgi:hypothetical protein